MSKTFNIELWEQLKEDFLDGSVFFGEAPEDAPAPYCVIHVLDSGDDESSKTSCGGMTGISNLQFNIHGFNNMQIDELLDELNALLKTYALIEFDDYRIIEAKRDITKGAENFSAETGMGLTRFDFEWERL
jgi:hypothetical protein